VLLGVCGTWNNFRHQRFLVPAGFLIAFLPGGVPGISLYLLAWLIIPSE
jgi:phage shock protein PspC (stress-responsive transcriptional regulator)